MIGVTRDLSLSGCFIRAKAPFQKGTAVIVRIRCSGTDFAATGRVTANVNAQGMGIEFVEIQPKDQATIEQWLDPRPPLCRNARSLPVTVFGQLSSGDFSEETETRISTYDTASLRLAAAVSPGQVVRLRNRLTHDEQKCRVVSVTPEARSARSTHREAAHHRVPGIGAEFLEFSRRRPAGPARRSAKLAAAAPSRKGKGECPLRRRCYCFPSQRSAPPFVLYWCRKFSGLVFTRKPKKI